MIGRVVGSYLRPSAEIMKWYLTVPGRKYESSLPIGNGPTKILQLYRGLSSATESLSGFHLKSSKNPNLIASHDKTLGELESGLTLIPNFISEEEESALFEEVNPYLRKLRYERSHWDDAIHDYRETEKGNWNENNSLIIERLKCVAFAEGSTSPLAHTHILDLSANGFIRPHVDAVRFCGNTVAGISLLSDSVMRFIREDDKSCVGDLFLRRRSLYVMRDLARFLYTHEILKDEESFFDGAKVDKGRRISVICRNSPIDS